MQSLQPALRTLQACPTNNPRYAALNIHRRPAPVLRRRWRTPAASADAPRLRQASLSALHEEGDALRAALKVRRFGLGELDCLEN